MLYDQLKLKKFCLKNYILCIKTATISS